MGYCSLCGFVKLSAQREKRRTSLLFSLCTESFTKPYKLQWKGTLIESEQNLNTKYLFEDNRRKEPGGVYEPYLYQKLMSVQTECVGLIPKGLEIDTYGIGRLFRCGSVTAAENTPNDKCGEEDIKQNNRWRLEDSAGIKGASFDMLQFYTDTVHSVGADFVFVEDQKAQLPYLSTLLWHNKKWVNLCFFLGGMMVWMNSYWIGDKYDYN